MGHFACLVQQDSLADRRRAALEDRLSTLHARHFAGEAATFSWRAAPDGFMFTEGRPSTSSVVSCQVAHPTTREARERYLRGVCDVWTEVTGCTDHEILASMTEADRT